MAKTRKSGGWNAKKSVGAKRPFTLEQVQLIRAALEARGDIRGLALLETGISTVLRAGDLLGLSVGDVVGEDGMIVDSFNVRQQKTERGVTVSLSERAKTALAAYIEKHQLDHRDRLWKLGRLRYSQIVKSWARLAHADPRLYSTHSIRRTMPTHIHKRTGSHEVARQLLGHANLTQTQRYLGLANAEAHAIKKQHEM